VVVKIEEKVSFSKKEKEGDDRVGTVGDLVKLKTRGITD